MDDARLQEIIRESDKRIRQVIQFTDEVRDAAYALRALKQSMESLHTHEIRQLRRDVDALKTQLEKAGMPRIDTYERNFDEVRSLLSKGWPEALPEEDIVRTEQQQAAEANTVLDFVVTESLDGKRFLDFGCGKGWTATLAATRGANVIGYDPVDQWHNQPVNKSLLTTDYQKVVANGPYDIILLFDVLDHSEQDPVSILINLQTILQPGGRIFVWNHPWCSRHGAHLHTSFNRAFAHLVFDELELTRIGGYVPEKVRHITRPLQTYRQWFADARFKIINETVISNDVDEFFLRPEHDLLWARICKHWGDYGIDPKEFLSIHSVEFILEPQELEHQVI